MPLHFENSISIPTSQFELPKHAMDFSAHQDNKFLNRHQHKIEELAHRFPEHPLGKWILREQLRLYSNNYEILNHDGFYQSRLRDGYRFGINPNFAEVRNVGVWGSLGQFIEFGVVAGATLETNDGSTGSGGSMDAHSLKLNKLPTGTIGASYNWISQHLSGTTGNLKHAVYTDSTPGARLAVTGSIAAYSSYAAQSVTSFVLSATANWAASVDDATVEYTQYYYKNQSSGDVKSKTVVFATGPPDPAGTGYSDATAVYQMKIGYT